MKNNNKNKLMFICTDSGCKYKFSSNEYETKENNEPDAEHGFIYSSFCPICDSRAELNPVQLNLFKAWEATRQPRSGQALANIRAGNENKNTDLSRFNALNHGLTARTARFFPAKPGKYAACDGCEYFDNGCATTSTACLKRAELFMQFELAVTNNDPNMLNRLMSDMQAGLMAVQADMLSEIAQSGVVIHDPVTYTDKETGAVGFVTMQDPMTGEKKQLTNMRDHPLLKRLIEFVSKNNQTLADMNMTKRQVTEEETLNGFLTDEKETREEARERQAMFAQRQAILLNVEQDALQNMGNIGETVLIPAENKAEK